MADMRAYFDWVWPSLAPHAPGYLSNLEKRKRLEIAAIRLTCAADVDKQQKWVAGARQELCDEEERKKATVSALQGLLGLTSLLVALMVGLSLWLSLSHTLKLMFPSVLVLVAAAVYPTMQMIGALLAMLSGLRARPFSPIPHVAEALADPMDVAEEMTMACLLNGNQTDDRVSYKKLAHSFLRNAGTGLIPLALLLVGATLYNGLAGSTK